MESKEEEKSSNELVSIRKKNISPINIELLTLVSRGSAIICEILRLKDYIPEPYSNKNEEKLYKDIIFDYSIFKNGLINKFESKLISNKDLNEKDDNFRINHIEIIERFFLLFQSIYQYVTDWKTFISHVRGKRFAQYTIDNILTNKELSPLFSESLFISC